VRERWRRMTLYYFDQTRYSVQLITYEHSYLNKESTIIYSSRMDLLCLSGSTHLALGYCGGLTDCPSRTQARAVNGEGRQLSWQVTANVAPTVCLRGVVTGAVGYLASACAIPGRLPCCCTCSNFSVVREVIVAQMASST
jgi:hypothetical protein